MMSLKSWTCLLIVYVLYLVLGGFAFRALENPCYNDDLKEDAAEERRQMKAVLDEVQGTWPLSAS